MPAKFLSGLTDVDLIRRREERLYVEGMEDEDMKKETQNLAYPPAFKLGRCRYDFQSFIQAFMR